MDMIFSDQPLVVRHPSVFLAGPTPRSNDVRSWRPEALNILRRIGFPGTVLVPERRDWSVQFDYFDQVEWEHGGLECCTIIAFWMPRQIEALPGFTSNVEFGRYVGSGRVVYGRPEGAPHTRYLDWLFEKVTGSLPQTTLEETLQASMRACSRPATALDSRQDELPG
jgi:hypothetical protein